MSESDIQRAIINALTAKGYWVQRLNAGVQVIGSGRSKRVVKGCEPGTPDILVKAPVYGFLEVKTATGRLNDNQRAWHDEASSRGVRVAIVRSISDAIKAVEEWQCKTTTQYQDGN